MQPPQTISQGQEGVATALVACKILREMSHLEAEAEADRSSRVASYEQLALGEPLPGLWAPPQRPGHPTKGRDGPTMTSRPTPGAGGPCGGGDPQGD